MAFLLRDPIMRPSTLGLAVLNLFNFAFQGLFVLYATRNLGIEPGLLGIALGPAPSAASSVRWPRRGSGGGWGIGGAFVLAMVIFPASAILVPLAEGLPEPAILALLFAAEFIGGFGVIVLDINAGAMLIARTPDAAPRPRLRGVPDDQRRRPADRRAAGRGAGRGRWASGRRSSW